MFVTSQPTVAIILCLVTMLCWGSWANAQKYVTKSAQFYVFYRDYVYGIVATSIILALTLGSLGSEGRPVLEDIRQAELNNILLAVAGGVVFNVGNMLLTVGINIAGLSVAMPVGTGLSLAIGLVVNYLAEKEGNVALLAVGGGLIIAAMTFGALAYKVKQDDGDNSQDSATNRGIWIALAGGFVAGFFFRITSDSLIKDFTNPETGLLTPYTSLVLFTLGMLLINPLAERLVRRYALPDTEDQKDYRTAARREHLVGISGGAVWCIGFICLLLGANEAGDAVSYGLSQGATVVSVLWGLFAWQEFQGAPAKANRFLWLMGGTYVVGLILIVLARA